MIKMIKMLKKLWRNDDGAFASMELILIATIAVIGIIVGLTTYRNTLVQELGDSAAAMARLNQGYQINRINIARNFPIAGGGVVRVRSTIRASNYRDRRNFGQPANVDPNGQGPMCIRINLAPEDE